jgi:riboflavin transporter FmnP
MNNGEWENRSKILKIAKMGMLAAISLVLVAIVHFPIIPGFAFLEYDPADVPILIGAFAYGPLAGIALTVVVSVVQGATVSAAGGPWGILMHIIATGTLVTVAGGIYKFKKSKKTAVIALIAGAISMTAVMCFANILITPIYTGWPREAVVAVIAPAILPFNLIKSGVNAAVTFLLYKRISPLLHR